MCSTDTVRGLRECESAQTVNREDGGETGWVAAVRTVRQRQREEIRDDVARRN